MTFDEKGKVVKLFSQPKRPLELAHIFKSVVFGKDGKGISFKNRLKGHINWQKFVFNLLIPDHNPDVFNPPYDRNNNNALDSIIHKLLGGFIRWDGVYFLHVAEYGYIYENSLAFFPLFPWSVRILANSLFWPLQFVIQYRTTLILSGLLFNLFIHMKSTIVLFRLSKNILNSEFMAYQSAILFCINPASIFFSAFYSETLFTYLTFSSMLMFEEKKKNLSLLYSSLSCVTRSNGLLTAGFELHRTCQVIVNYILQRQLGYIDKFVSVLKGIVKLMVFLLIFLLPFVVYQFYISDLFCNKNVKWPIPDFLIEYGQQRNYNLLTNTTFDWCKRRLPFSYSNVQNTHWNVGFLRYYEIKQIPNFILALPVSYFSISSILYYYRQNKGTCITLGFIPDLKDHHQTGFRRRQLLPYVVYLLFITLFGWIFMHIQVLTRLVFSSSPVLYWYTAEIVSSDQRLKKESCTNKKHSYKNCDIINKISCFSSQNAQTKMIILYFMGYFIVGTFMFSNFLPWT